MSHPRYKRLKKKPEYKLRPQVRKAIKARLGQMVCDGCPGNRAGVLLDHLVLEFGRDAIAAYREEVTGA